MDLRKLKTLIDLVSESNLSELEITEAEGKVRIVKACAQPPTAPQTVYMHAPVQSPAAPADAAAAPRTALPGARRNLPACSARTCACSFTNALTLLAMGRS